MRFGINTLLWTAAFDREHLGLLPRIREWGFDGVEIARFDYEGFPAKEIRRALADNGLEVTACSALTGSLSLINEDAGVRKHSREFMTKAIEAGAAMGAKVLVGPYVSPVGHLTGRRRTDDEWKRAVEELSQLATALSDHDMTLAVEPLNRFECYSLNTAADAVQLCEAVGNPRVGVLFDTFHANIEEKTIAGAVEMLGRHTMHVHACENDRGIPGSGHVDWDGLFGSLKRTGYDGWVVIESFGQQIPEIAAAACIWRDLAPQPDMIASEGVKFLREMHRTHYAG
jgi:D-psicose/D-tagatose/L-ribulose 3-epimerase